MKRNLTLLSFIFVLCSSKFIAQTYNALNLTGFNTDVIAETKPAAASTSATAVDAAGYVLYSAAYTGTVLNTGGLNVNRTYTTASRTYSLAPYNANNALRVIFGASDSLKLATPVNASVLSLLAFSSGIDALTDITVRFTDGTSVAFNSKTIYNWTSSTQPSIFSGFGETNRATDAIYYNTTTPKFYAIDLPIACTNQTKLVSKVIVKNNSNGATVFVFAASSVKRPNYVASAIPATCKGRSTGSENVFGVDMYGPVSYTWSSAPVQNTQTATNLPAGNYTVNLVDGNGCAFTETATVTEPATSFSIASITSSSLTCASVPTGSANVNVAGGAPPYTFLWSNAITSQSITGLSAGTYSVMATDANKCVITASTTVSAPIVLITVNTSSLLCGSTPNATATVGSVIGATGPFTYTWTSSPAQTTATATALAAGNYSVLVKDAVGCVNTQTFTILAPSFNVTTAGTTCTLSTGSATVSGITGGSGAPYTYTWTPAGGSSAAASGLAAGNYSVTVTDAAACATTKTVTITALNPTLTVSTGSLACGNVSNGTATVTVSGGAGGPYTYTWSSAPVQTTPTASNLGAGIYNVTVKGVSGCVASQTFAITQPTLSIVTASNSCKGLQPTGGATVTAVNGGTSPYMYSWDPSSSSSTPYVNGLVDASYTVNVTDANSCIITGTYTITAPSTASLVAVASSSAATCSGINNGKAMVNGVTGGTPPYTYSWNSTPPQFTALATGLGSPNTYVCTIVDYNNCIINRSATVYPAPLNINIYANPSYTICPTHSVTLSVAGAVSYTWSTGASTSSVTVVPTGTLSTTVYSFTGTTTAGCIITGSTAIMTNSTACVVGIEEQHGNVGYSLYPNPNNGQFVLVLDQAQDNATLEVIDALGKLAISQSVNGMQTTVNTSVLQDGIYFVTVKNKDRIVVRTKIIKQ